MTIFEEAIINAVEQFGTNVVEESRLVNILSDLNAYEEKPACKRILREIINSGISSKLKSQQSGLSEIYIRQAICQLKRDFGFQEDLIEYILYSIYNSLRPKEERIIQNESSYYEYIGTEDEYGLRDVRKNGKWGFITSDKKEIVPPIYDYVSSFHEGLAEVSNNGKCGFINLSGTVVISLIYDSLTCFRSGISIVKSSNKYGIIDKSGNIILPIIYDEIKYGNSDMIGIKQGTNWGFSTLTGIITIKPRFKDILKHFSKGYALVSDGVNKLIINTKGEIIQKYLR